MEILVILVHTKSRVHTAYWSKYVCLWRVSIGEENEEGKEVRKGRNIKVLVVLVHRVTGVHTA